MITCTDGCVFNTKKTGSDRIVLASSAVMVFLANLAKGAECGFTPTPFHSSYLAPSMHCYKSYSSGKLQF